MKHFKSILKRLLRIRQPECPRVLHGYSCHKYSKLYGIDGYVCNECHRVL